MRAPSAPAGASTAATPTSTPTSWSVTVASPGHVDFSAEAERTLAALDLAVLVVGANDGIQGHTRTLWRLLERHGIPTIIFANKIDLLPDAGSPAERDTLLATLRARLSEGCLPVEELTGEAAAMTDEVALEEFLEAGTLDDATTRRLFAERHVFPCLFGSALKNEGVTELLDIIAELAPTHTWPDEFAARVYRVSRDDRGERGLRAGARSGGHRDERREASESPGSRSPAASSAHASR